MAMKRLLVLFASIGLLTTAVVFVLIWRGMHEPRISAVPMRIWCSHEGQSPEEKQKGHQHAVDSLRQAVAEQEAKVDRLEAELPESNGTDARRELARERRVLRALQRRLQQLADATDGGEQDYGWKEQGARLKGEPIQSGPR
jgi:hypothetical protein